MNFDLCRDIMDNMSKVIVGKRDAMELLLVGLLAEGHVLLEDVPGGAFVVPSVWVSRFPPSILVEDRCESFYGRGRRLLLDDSS